MTAALIAVALIAVLAIVATGSWLAAGGGRPRGLATGLDVVRTMSATSVRLRGRYTRPSLTMRPWTDVREVGIYLARAGRRRLYAALEDIVLVLGGPRSGKTGWLAGRVLDAPGPCVVTSTRPDLHRLTADGRGDVGPVDVFNPEDVGGVLSTVRWSPVVGCHRPAEAIMRAGYLLSGAPGGGVNDRSFWEGQAHRALRGLLMAAALSDDDMHAVARWAGNLSDERPIAVLRSSPAAPRGWADALRHVQTMPEKTRDSVAATLSGALEFMADPALAHAATPTREQHFDVASFLTRPGTLYLLGERREHAPISSLLTAFTGHLWETGKAIAARSPGGRLDPPALSALDEAYRICQLPLAQWTSEAGGSGLPIIISLQGPDQLDDAWGEHGGATIRTNAAVRLQFGGLHSARHLDELSTLCGQRWNLRDGHLERIPVLEPGQIMRIPDQQVLLVRKNTGALIARAPMWETRRRTRPEAHAAERDWTGPLATVIRLADWRRRRDQRERDAS